MLTRQAKVLTKKQIALALTYLQTTRYPIRNRVIFLLSVRAGLRAKEIASITWTMVTDAEGNLGDEIRLQNVAAKGRSGRVIPLNKELKEALQEWLKAKREASCTSPYVITTERTKRTSPTAVANMFSAWFCALGFEGCSSHSGRRTFITNAARQIGLVGGSLRDVQQLAGHSSLATTQVYIQADAQAMRRIVDLV